MDEKSVKTNGKSKLELERQLVSEDRRDQKSNSELLQKVPKRKMSETSRLSQPNEISKQSGSYKKGNATRKSNQAQFPGSPVGTSKQSNNSSVCIHGAFEPEGRLEKRYDAQGRAANVSQQEAADGEDGGEEADMLKQGSVVKGQ